MTNQMTEQYITKIKIQKIYTGLNWQDLEEQRLLFVFQDYYLMDSLSIKENIMLPLILDEADIQESKKNVRKWLRSLQLRIYWIKNHMNYQEEKTKNCDLPRINLQSGFDFGGRTNRKSGLCLIRGCNTYFRRD